MIFTDLRFVLIFALCWATFFAVPRAWRAATLAVWGMVFYVTFAGWFIGIVLVLTMAALAFPAPIAGVLIVGMLVYAKLGTGGLVPLGSLAEIDARGPQARGGGGGRRGAPTGPRLYGGTELTEAGTKAAAGAS